MMANRMKSLRTEIIFYCFVSMFLSVLTEIALGVLIYAVSIGMGRKKETILQIKRQVSPVMNSAGSGYIRMPHHSGDYLSRQTLVSIMLVIILATIFFFVIYLLLFMKKIIKDMQYVSDHIAHIASGDTIEPIDLGRRDEIGEIAHKVNEMTKRIDDLMYSEREALQSNKDLITCVAHDLRTPITSVKGYLDLALDTKHYELEQRQKFVKTAQDKANRLEYLIEDLFRYTKLMSGEICLHKYPMDLVQLVNQMVEEFYPLFQEQHLECVTMIRAKQITLCLDGELIARAVQNLLSNAIKYGCDGKRVLVELEELTGEVQLRVTNFGRVIPEESLEHLFDKFYRVENSRSRMTGGSGLGLNIAQEIIRLHGGEIKVTSDINGTCFIVALPQEAEQEQGE